MENNEILIEMKGDGKHTFWTPCSMDDFLMNMKITRDIILETGDMDHPLELYEDNVALTRLRQGEVISIPCLFFRLANGDTCPKCGGHFDQSIGAISRHDNSTHICCRCGEKEAMEDFRKAKRSNLASAILKKVVENGEHKADHPGRI